MDHFTKPLADVDPDVYAALEAETVRQRDRQNLR